MIFLAAFVLVVPYWNEDLKVQMFVGKFMEIFNAPTRYQLDCAGITITTLMSIVAIDS